MMGQERGSYVALKLRHGGRQEKALPESPATNLVCAQAMLGLRTHDAAAEALADTDLQCYNSPTTRWPHVLNEAAPSSGWQSAIF